ncbi:hypothetical protein [Rathayibacter rathayi]|uniref:hypothetical protein n=1 Tax=Rathayibacter rathayi TaxID=33887 RepID=UPI001CA5D436|nr:hypothetical protein [Rathayibacter rathayi]
MRRLARAEALARAGHDITVWALAGGDASVFRPVDPAVTVRVVPFPHREGEVRAAMEALAAAYS